MPVLTRMTSAVLLCLLAVGTAGAEDYQAGTLTVRQPWIRATPKGAAVTSGYMTVVNNGTAPDRLIGGSAAVAGRFEIHSMTMDQGVMKMRPVPAGLEIKPGQTLDLSPGGAWHVMLMGLKGPVQAGQLVKGTLIFEKAGPVEVEYRVEPLGRAPAGHQGH
jgi:copper(I)-binding protein